MNNSEQLFRCLSALGVDYCACVSGGGIMYLVDAVAKNKKMLTRYFHHEQSAAFAAEAYARASGRPAICLVTIGPGVANAVAGAFSAYINSVPCIFISGAKRSNIVTNYKKVRFNYPQDVDTENLVSSVVKKFYALERAEDIDKLISDAVSESISGRPGPVWISIPLDLQGAIAANSVKKKASTTMLLSPRGPTERNIDNTIQDFLKDIRKPVFIVGRGVESVMRDSAYQNFLKKTKIPFLTTIGSNHVISGAGEKNLGFFGPTGRRAANLVLSEADAIIAIGSGLDIDNTGFDRQKFFENKKVLLINSDPHLDISDCCSSFQKICLDLRQFNFSKFASILSEKGVDYKQWTDFAIETERLFSIEWEVARNLTEDAVDPYYCLLELVKLLPGNVGIAGGISLDVHAFSHVAKLKKTQEFFLSSHCGQLGWDLPAAVGLADTNRYDSIVCITGDGSAMFNIQELATLTKTGQRIAIIIFDNAGYNSIRTSQDIHLSGRRYGSDLKYLAFPEWRKLAKAFDFEFLEIADNNQIKKLKAIQSIQKLIVRVVVDPNRNRTPRLVSKILNGKFQSPSLAEQYPFLDDPNIKKFQSLKKSFRI